MNTPTPEQRFRIFRLIAFLSTGQLVLRLIGDADSVLGWVNVALAFCVFCGLILVAGPSRVGGRLFGHREEKQ